MFFYIIPFEYYAFVGLPKALASLYAKLPPGSNLSPRGRGSPERGVCSIAVIESLATKILRSDPQSQGPTIFPPVIFSGPRSRGSLD